MSELTYHQATFYELGLTPVISPARQALIAERERICGVTFPASVKEWMSIEGVEDIFHDNTNQDSLPALEPLPYNFPLGRPKETDQGWLCVACENQAVVIWYVRLDAGDDPPVYHDDNEMWYIREANLPLDKVNWCHVSNTFSEFMFHMVASREPISLSAGDRFPTEEEYERLRSRFVQAHTAPPATVEFVIPHPHARINPQASMTIQAMRDKNGEMKAFYYLHADSPALMHTLVKGVWDIASLSETLTGDEESEIFLSDIRYRLSSTA